MRASEGLTLMCANPTQLRPGEHFGYWPSHMAHLAAVRNRELTGRIGLGGHRRLYAQARCPVSREKRCPRCTR